MRDRYHRSLECIVHLPSRAIDWLGDELATDLDFADPRRRWLHAARRARKASHCSCAATSTRLSGLWSIGGKLAVDALFAADRAILGCHRAVPCPIPSRSGPACPHMRVAEAPSPIGLRQVTSIFS